MEVLGDGFRPEFQPVFKMRFLHRHFGIHREVRGHRIAFIRNLPEEQRFPESIHFRQVFTPVHLSHVIKEKTNRFILLNLLIKSVDQEFYICACF